MRGISRLGLIEKKIFLWKNMKNFVVLSMGLKSLLSMPLPRINQQPFLIEREREHLVSREFSPHLRDIDIMLEFVPFRNNHELDDPIGHCPHQVLLPVGKNAAVNHEKEGRSFPACRYQAE